MSRPVWTSLDGQGSWDRQPAPGPVLPSLAVLVALAVAITLWIGFVFAGRAAMCASHDQRLSYCPGYHQHTEQTR